MFENDYIMRLIHEMVRAILKLLFGINTESQLEEAFEENRKKEDEENGLVWKLLGENKINEAENILLEKLRDGKQEDLKNALFFYEYLNNLDDETLERAQFTREEIRDGLRGVLGRCGYGGLGDGLL